jgi:hypothetical protein
MVTLPGKRQFRQAGNRRLAAALNE